MTIATDQVYVSDPNYTGAGANKIYNIGGYRVQAPTEAVAATYLFNNNLPVPDQMKSYYNLKTPVAQTAPITQVQAGSIDRGGRDPRPTTAPTPTTTGSNGTTPGSGVTAQMRHDNPAQAQQLYDQAAQTQSTQNTPSGSAPLQSSVYQGSSIVDFLNSTGKASDFNSRAQLAKQYGITNYTGSAAQNTSLLNTLRNSGVQSNPTTSLAGVGMTTPNTPQTTNSSDPMGIKAVAKSLMEQYGLSPTSNTPVGVAETYTQLAKSLGLTDIKAQYEKVLKEQGKVQDELNGKIADINENPWLTEGTRVNQINKLQERYATKLDTLVNQEKLFDSLYQQGVQQAQFLTGQVMTEQHQQQVLREDAVNMAIKLAQDQIDAQAKLDSSSPASYKEYQLAKQEGYTGSYNDYQTMDANRKRAVTNVTITNQADTQSAEAKLLAARGADGYTDPNLYASLRAGAKISATEFDNKLGYLVNPLSVGRLGIAKASTSVSADQQSIINDAKAAIDYAKQTYQDVPQIRSAIIQKSIQEYGFDPSPYI